ncbi:Bug family tripartite tricarboxylate transporter substrate binding protein [Cupriavidus sp. NPDC089707]|uniref:Bug family tripartite tricarboxylate transporter substrate binding protein n=1 Tax=Cupriavidus sp. NPDC089707 TaxID=3363963 RepID=UPI0037F64D27
MRYLRNLTLGMSLALLSAGSALAAYPERVIRMIVPFAAGGGADIVARMLAEDMRSSLGVSVLVENLPGASATIGATRVARAAPDGYTLLLTTGTTHSAGPALFKKLPFDPIKDFTPVALITKAPLVLLVDANAPVRTLDQLLTWLRANPSRASYGHSSSTSHVAGSSLVKRAGLPVTAVPYNGATQVMTDLAGGSIGFTFVDLAAARSFLATGRVKAIAVTSLQRSTAMPDVPTVAESGLPGFETIAWSGIFAPAGTPAAAVETLSAAVRKTLSSNSIRNQLTKLGSGEPSYLPPAEMASFVKAQLSVWTEKIREAGIEPQ